MKLRTEIKIPASESLINYGDSLFFIGSCFSENIGAELQKRKFNSLINPFGVLYNPISINNSIERILSQKPYTSADLFLQEGIYKSYDHHSSFADIDEQKTLEKINSALKNAGQFLESASHIFITLGTAIAYRLLDEVKVVANCHKAPASTFKQIELGAASVAATVKDISSNIKNINPNAAIFFTVSPVRHWKNGAVKNMQSKAALISGIHEAIELGAAIDYFPSFEIMMDELRDYRFYRDDLLHVNDLGIQYILEKFSKSFMSNDTAKQVALIVKVITAANHRPFNPETEQHQHFIQQQLKQIESLKSQIPSIDLSTEVHNFKAQLIS